MQASTLPLSYALCWTGNVSFGLQEWSCRLVNVVAWELLGFQELCAPCTCLRLCSTVGAYLITVVAAVMWYHQQMGGSCSCCLHFS